SEGKPPFRLHDFRHNFASIGVGAGMGLPIVGKLLGHTQAATTQRYAHLDADPLRRATNAIGAAIVASMNKEAEGQDLSPRNQHD
ncbi:MAG TPA: tyrosine-type recombinase/integrase, partial [Roseiarcus sp.]